MRSTIGNAHILEKRVPDRNKRYQTIGPRIDSGTNMKKIMEQYEGTSGPNARVRVHDEYFQRIKPTTLGSIVEDIARQAEESIYTLGEQDAASVATSVRSGLASVVHSEQASPSPAQVSESHGNLLLLDVRQPNDFDEWHIRGAVSYPPTQMIHANNSLPRDIYYYKGSRGSAKMVVVYDDDGRFAVEAGNLLVQKGVDNTYVLGGGLKEFAPRFPHLLEGNVPDLPPPRSPVQPLSALTHGHKHGVAGGSKTPSIAQSVSESRRDDSHSVQSPRTVNTQLSRVGSQGGAGAGGASTPRRRAFRPGSQPWK